MNNQLKRSIFSLMLVFAACGEGEPLDGAADEAVDESSDFESDSSDIGSEAQALTGYGVGVDCRAVNAFGYIGSVKGDLKIVSHVAPQGFKVKGKLIVKRRQYGVGSWKTSTLNYQGYVDGTGSYANVKPVKANAIKQIWMYFNTSFQGYIDADNGIQYQTRCDYSIKNIPNGADLAFRDRKLAFGGTAPGGKVYYDVWVRNIGNAPVNASSGKMKINNQIVDVTLSPSPLPSGGEGLLRAALVNNGSIYRCGEFPVQLDTSHTMQNGQPNPFNNDTNTVRAPCIAWDTVLDQWAFGPPSGGLKIDPELAGKTLGQIVNSQVEARSDNLLCKNCHYDGSGRQWTPAANQAWMGPTTVVDGKAWRHDGGGNAGWAGIFQTKSIKPEYLKTAFLLWELDGGY